MRSTACSWASVGALALLGLGDLGCDRSTADCGGYCGEGTVCEANRCVVAPPTEPAEAETGPEAPETGKRGRRKGRRRDEAAGGPGLPDKDGHIPRYRADRDETIGEGSERLPDREVRGQLSKLEPAFNRCLERASAVTDDALAGTVSFKIGIEPSGKVWGVNANLPKAWDVPGLRACFRNVIYDHRFPSWDGPSMGVDYHFKVD